MLRALLALSISGLLSATAAGEAAYVLEYPGVVFEWLPPELAEPVEGDLTPEAGVVTSSPNTTGTEYIIRYWREDIPAGEPRAAWLDTRLESLFPPDLAGNTLMGNMQWVEGSQLTSCRSALSMGLMPSVNYNFIDEDGSVVGGGRAFAAFRNGYAVLLYCLAPGGSSDEATRSLEAVVLTMHLAEE
jgi:hypothetical protein